MLLSFTIDLLVYSGYIFHSAAYSASERCTNRSRPALRADHFRFTTDQKVVDKIPFPTPNHVVAPAAYNGDDL